MIDWEARANSAGLLYVQDFEHGFSRKKSGKGFKFLGLDGKTLVSKEVRQRILSLVIPPAWKDVWICTEADGHIQATGFDEAGRKQYTYHPRWHEASSAHKYGRLKVIAGLMPTIRKHVNADLKDTELSKRRVVAAVVRLLDKACIRIGNKQYLEANDSRGATSTSRSTEEKIDCSLDQRCGFWFGPLRLCVKPLRQGSRPSQPTGSFKCSADAV